MKTSEAQYCGAGFSPALFSAPAEHVGMSACATSTCPPVLQYGGTKGRWRGAQLQYAGREARRRRCEGDVPGLGSGVDAHGDYIVATARLPAAGACAVDRVGSSNPVTANISLRTIDYYRRWGGELRSPYKLKHVPRSKMLLEDAVIQATIRQLSPRKVPPGRGSYRHFRRSHVR